MSTKFDVYHQPMRAKAASISDLIHAIQGAERRQDDPAGDGNIIATSTWI
jgi:hypothetical protein